MQPSPRRRTRLAIAAVACALVVGCSKVDDFTAFRFGDGGSGDGGGSSADLAGSMVGDPCAVACTGGLSCFTTVSNASFPGGICSTTCSTQTPSCPTGGGCGQVGDTSVCLQSCNPSAGIGCRIGWSCCNGQNTVTGPGLCGPSNSNFCGH